MATRRIDTQTITDIADAIRVKTGKSASMTPLEMPDEIESIETGSGAAASANILNGVPLNPGYLSAGGVPQTQDGTRLEVYTDEIDVSDYLGRTLNIYVLTSSVAQHWIGYCFFSETHAFVSPRVNVMPADNVNACGMSVSIPTSGVKYIRFSFRTYGNARYAASVGNAVYNAVGVDGFSVYPGGDHNEA